MFFEKSKIEVEKYPHVERKLATATEKGYVKINGEEIRPKIDLCYQQGLQENMLTTEADILFLGGEPGSGKALSINELVCTPNGFVRNGDLKVGDIISGVDGLPQTVLGVYDQGEMDMYRLFFTDGSSCTTTLDHLWKVRKSGTQTKAHTRSKAEDRIELSWRIQQFSDIKDYLDKKEAGYFKRKKSQNLLIPLCNPIEFESNLNLPIDPYLLGAILGDGHIPEKGNMIGFTNIDKELICEVSRLGFDIKYKEGERHYHYCNRELKDKFRELGLTGKLSDTKFIPEMYKYASIEDRKSILAGLMDTDGSVGKSGGLEFTSTSERLANDVKFIIESLGGRATISSRIPFYRDKNKEKVFCKRSYRLYIQTPFNKDLFRLTRKKERCADGFNGGQSPLCRRIDRYEYIGKEECRCISVSNPDSLYVASSGFVVTHNTYGLLLAALQGIDKKGYSGLIIKKELVSTKDTAGGMMQDAKIVLEEFADCQYRASDNPTFIYPTWGSAVSFTHSNFESTTEKRVREAQERAKNFQCSFIAFDELTNFSFDNWWYWTSRNRDSSGMKSKMVCTFNTNSHHFTRTMIDWYIGEDGRVIEDRIGKIRYFYKQGETERDFVWGNSKEEVIRKAGLTVREDLKEAGINPETMVKSFTFMPSRMVDNRILINATEGGHVANIANMGGAEREKLFDSNWNADTSGDAIVTRDMIKDIFKNEGIEDETMYATLDVSGGGDNCIMIIWRGLRIKHILKFDGLSNDRSQFYKELEVWIDRMLTKYDVNVHNFAFDGSGNGQYLKSYTNGRPIVGNMSAIIEYDDAGNKAVVEQYFNLRSQLMGKMHYLLDMGMIGCDVDPKQLFHHGKNKVPRELEEILCEEAEVFMRTTKGNKYYFKSKDEFKDRYNYSPDFIDPIIYRAIFEIDQSRRKELEDELTIFDYEF